MFDTTLSWQTTKDLTLVLNADYGNEATALAGNSGTSWYGLAGYGTRVLMPQFVNFNLRGEYIVDETGSRLPASTDTFEVTAGLDIHPVKKFQNLRVRPEVRWDHSLGDNLFDLAHPRKDQVTFAADLIITF